MIKVDLTAKFKALSGEEANKSLGKVLAEVLYNSHSKDSIKAADMSLSLWNDKVLELSSEDAEFLKTFICETQFIVNGAKSQMLGCFSE